jgi:hypothetical protein
MSGGSIRALGIQNNPFDHDALRIGFDHYQDLPPVIASRAGIAAFHLPPPWATHVKVTDA